MKESYPKLHSLKTQLFLDYHSKSPEIYIFTTDTKNLI